MWQKFKSFLTNDTYFTVLLILLVGIISFGLGRLSILEQNTQNQATASISQLTPLEPQNTPQNDLFGPVVASKSGTRYHLPDCPGVKQMSEANKIKFTTIGEAKAAGYTAAGNCPGI